VVIFLGFIFRPGVHLSFESNRVVPTSQSVQFQPAQSKVVKSKPKYSKFVVPLSDRVLRKKH